MPSDIAQTEQTVTEVNDKLFAWKVDLKFCRQSQQNKNMSYFMKTLHVWT